MSIISFRTFRTNTNRTEHCLVRVRLEQNFLEPLLVRFEPNTNRTRGLFGSATLEQCLCSVRDRTEQTEQTRTCTVRQAISASLESPLIKKSAKPIYLNGHTSPTLFFRINMAETIIGLNLKSRLRVTSLLTQYCLFRVSSLSLKVVPLSIGNPVGTVPT